MNRNVRRVALITIGCLLAACGIGEATQREPIRHVTPDATATPAATATATPTPTANPTATPTVQPTATPTTTPTPTPTPGCLRMADYPDPPAINAFPHEDQPDAELEFRSPNREPSGLVYVPAYDSIFMVDDGGAVVRLSKDLGVLDDWTVGGDLEGITYDPATNQIYVVVEYPPSLREYTFNPGARTLTFRRQWDLSGVFDCSGVTNSCLEGATYVPTDESAEGGLFYVGWQNNGAVSIVELPLQPGSSFAPRLFTRSTGRSTISPPPGLSSDVSDLYYETASRLIYVIFDSYNRMSVIDTATDSYVKDFWLPSHSAGTSQNEEGFTFDDRCAIHFGEDTVNGQSYGRVRRFDPP